MQHGLCREFKICQSEEDKIQGCLERIYTEAALIPYRHGALIQTGCDCAYEFPYKNGKIEGIAKVYSYKKLAGTYPYKNGKLDGIQKRYDENGNLKQETPYKNNVIDGVEKRYYENGDLIAEITYKNEKIIVQMWRWKGF